MSEPSRRHSKSYLLRITPEEFGMLTELSDHLHIRKLDLLRSLIVEAHREMTKGETRCPETVSL